MPHDNLIPADDYMTDFETQQEYWDSGLKNSENINITEPTEGWDYTPIKPQLMPVEALDTQILPELFERLVDDISHRMQAPCDFTAVSLMVALSSVIGRKFAIYPKQKDNWRVTPNLWGAIVGNPSTKKSPTLSEALKPIGQLEKKAYEDYTVEKKLHEIDCELQGYEEKEKKSKISKLVKAGNSAGARALLEGSEIPTSPQRRRYKVNDSTVEKLGELLSENPNGLLVVYDEITGILKKLDRENYQADRAFYLTAWGGDQPFTYDRIARGTIHIDAVTLSLIGGIQPARLKNYVSSAIAGNDTADGLFQRFQLIVYPDIKKGWKYVDELPDQIISDKVNELFHWIDSIDTEKPIDVKFTQEAQLIFIEWLTELEHELEKGDLHHAIESHLAKYRSLIPSLALVIEIADNPGQIINAVGNKSLLKACDWSDYLRSHAMRIYALGMNPEKENALLIVSRFKKLPIPFTQRDIHRKGWTGLTDVSEVKKAISLLVEHKYIYGETIRSDTGRPTEQFIINPRVLQDG